MVAHTGCQSGLLPAHTGLDGIVEDLVNRLNVLVWRCVENDDDGANEANGTTKLAESSQFFFQEIGTQNSSNQDTEGSKRRDQDGRREGICGEVANLSSDD